MSCPRLGGWDAELRGVPAPRNGPDTQSLLFA